MEGLRHYLGSLYEHWDEHLIPVEFAYNHLVQPSLGVSPFEFLYGYNPRTPLTIGTQTSISTASIFMQRLTSRIEAARYHLLQTQLKQAEAADSH